VSVDYACVDMHCPGCMLMSPQRESLSSRSTCRARSSSFGGGGGDALHCAIADDHMRSELYGERQVCVIHQSVGYQVGKGPMMVTTHRFEIRCPTPGGD
jgi:hypothetical protein